MPRKGAYRDYLTAVICDTVMFKEGLTQIVALAEKLSIIKEAIIKENIDYSDNNATHVEGLEVVEGASPIVNVCNDYDPDVVVKVIEYDPSQNRAQKDINIDILDDLDVFGNAIENIFWSDDVPVYKKEISEIDFSDTFDFVALPMILGLLINGNQLWIIHSNGLNTNTTSIPYEAEIVRHITHLENYCHNPLDDKMVLSLQANTLPMHLAAYDTRTSKWVMAEYIPALIGSTIQLLPSKNTTWELNNSILGIRAAFFGRLGTPEWNEGEKSCPFYNFGYFDFGYPKRRR